MPPEVSQSAGEVIRRHQKSAPVSVVAIANELGINVWEKQEMSPPVSGMLKPDKINGGTSGFSIIVRKGDSLKRKRFTVAHEIAHFVLHLDRVGGGIVDDVMYRSGLSTKEETEANRLAADILMPYALIRTLIESGYKTLRELADQLGVSETAMSIRLNILT